MQTAAGLATCTGCGRKIALTQSGVIWAHGLIDAPTPCPGSGRKASLDPPHPTVGLSRRSARPLGDFGAGLLPSLGRARRLLRHTR